MINKDEEPFMKQKSFDTLTTRSKIGLLNVLWKKLKTKIHEWSK